MTPRRFDRVAGPFLSGAAYFECVDETTPGELVWRDGSRWRREWGTDLSDALMYCENGLWREITEAK